MPASGQQPRALVKLIRFPGVGVCGAPPRLHTSAHSLLPWVVLCAEVTVSVYHRPAPIADTQRSGGDDGVHIKAKHLHDDFGSGGAVSSGPERWRGRRRPRHDVERRHAV